MERRLSQVREDVSRQTELHHSALQRAQLAEQQVTDLSDRLQGLEAELMTSDVHRDGLSHDRQLVSEHTGNHVECAVGEHHTFLHWWCCPPQMITVFITNVRHSI